MGEFDLIHTSPGKAATDEERQAFNQQAEQLEAYLNNLVGSSDPCVVCPEDGCISIDLSDCNNYEVLVTENITCMRIVGEGAPGTINFIIPPNVTRHICGFPSSFGGEGNECDVDLDGGAEGTNWPFAHMGSSAGGLSGGGLGKPGIPNAGQAQRTGGGGGGGGCVCVAEPPSKLTITCCSSDCEIDCNATDVKLDFRVCGGKAPYTWSTTAGTITHAGNGSSATLRPPTNAGGAVAGTAYQVFAVNGANCDTQGTRVWKRENWGCDDVLDSCTSFTSALACNAITCANGDVYSNAYPDGTSGGSCAGRLNMECFVSPTTPACDAQPVGLGARCDQRTAPMIAAGCEPCGSVMVGAVITVTDALGTSVSKTINPKN